jgi:hypothetical protein
MERKTQGGSGMTREEADDYASRMNARPGVVACVIRILPEIMDPPKDGDNGWDVIVTTSDGL